MSVRVATIPYGTVMVDFDGEVLMSLGIFHDNGGSPCVECVQIEPPVNDGWLLRETVDIPVSAIDRETNRGTRYALQDVVLR